MDVGGFFAGLLHTVGAVLVAAFFGTLLFDDAGIIIAGVTGVLGILFSLSLLFDKKEEADTSNTYDNYYDEDYDEERDMGEHPYLYDTSDKETFYKVGAQVIAAQQRALDEAKAKHLSPEETRRMMYGYEDIQLNEQARAQARAQAEAQKQQKMREAGKEQEDYINNIMKGL